MQNARDAGRPADEAAAEAAIGPMIREIDELLAKMRQDQTEIDQIKADNARLKVEGQALRRETLAVIDALNAQEPVWMRRRKT